MVYKIECASSIELMESVLKELDLPYTIEDNVLKVDSNLLKRNEVDIEQEMLLVLASIDHMQKGADEDEIDE